MIADVCDALEEGAEVCVWHSPIPFYECVRAGRWRSSEKVNEIRIDEVVKIQSRVGLRDRRDVHRSGRRSRCATEVYGEKTGDDISTGIGSGGCDGIVIADVGVRLRKGGVIRVRHG